MPPIASISRTTTYERRVSISLDADRRQETVIEAIRRRGFSFDWDAILRAAAGSSDPVASIERSIAEQLRADDFRDTLDALALNGLLLAAYIQRRHEEETGVQTPAPVLTFAEPALTTPEGAISFWQKLLGFTDEEAARILASMRERDAARKAMASRVRDSMSERVQNIFNSTKLTGADIERGDTLADFAKKAREIMPGASDAALETEYRTRLTEEYGGARQEQIVRRANVFPFTQFLALVDGRTTWWICLPMGTAGPQGRGYVAASDDPVWFTWRPPNHFRCRSDLSPISYREAQRMGILAQDGRTKIALIGSNPNRPYGDPPKFATDPDTGKLRAVRPAEGFGS